MNDRVEIELTLVNKLSEIQRTLNAPKGQFNSFGKYNYRSCEDILMAVKPLLSDLVLTVNDEMVLVGNRIYVKATACITDGKESISTSAFAREAEAKKGMDDAQVTGSTSSYARKYALNGLLLIDDNKDADHTNKHGKENEAEAMAKAASVKGVTPTAGSGEVLSESDKEWLAEHANRITEAFKTSADKAVKMMDKFDLSDVMDNPDTVTDAYAYRWSLLDSKCRTAITKARNQPTADEITAQA